MRNICIAIIVTLFITTSCRREAAAPPPVTKPPAPAPAPVAVPKPISTDLHWTAPGSWKQVPDTGPLRTTKYEVSPQPGAIVQISVTPLRGPAGGPLANTNRWRRQIGLPPITDPLLEKISSYIDTPVGKAQIVDVAGLPDDAKSEVVTHVAMISHKQRTWFIKMVGPRKAVDGAVKEQFNGFVRSFR